VRPRDLVAVSWFLLAAGGADAAGGTASVDEQRSAWRFRRAVVFAGDEGPFDDLVVPEDLGAKADLSDLRLIAGDGREVPYLVDRLAERDVRPEEWPGRLVDVRRERKRRSQWTVDLEAARRFDTIRVVVAGRDFAKRLRVETSEDGVGWRLVREDAGLFDRNWKPRIHHTTVALGQAIEARYLRLTAADRRSRPIDVRGVFVSTTRRLTAEAWQREVALTPLTADAPPDVTRQGVSVYRLELPDGLPCARLHLATADATFARRVVVSAVSEVGGQERRRTLGDGRLYRVQAGDELVDVSSPPLELAPREGRGAIEIAIYDGDSPPLREVRAVVSGSARRLLFAPPGGPLSLYYGNRMTRAPVYDLEPLRQRLIAVARPARAAVDVEVENPRFRPLPPLAFAALVGADLDVARWRFVRPLLIEGQDDIYSVRLRAADVARLRPDLGDLRLVDGAGRQVPYLVEEDAFEERVPLAVAPEREGTAGAVGGIRSRYRLALMADDGERRPRALPIVAVTLAVAEPFFSRTALVSSADPGRRRGRRILYAGPLAGQGDPGAPVRLPLDGRWRRSMTLEIDEGDNAALTLASVHALVRVPRMAFKARAGRYRLLLGSPEATSPRYDLAALRREVLDYSAISVVPQTLAANAAYRRGLGDYVQKAPPTVLLWATILVAIVALVALTLRAVRQAPPTAQPPVG